MLWVNFCKYCNLWSNIFLLHVDTQLSQDLSGGSVVKNLPANAGDMVPSLGWEDPLEKEMAAHSSVLAWKSHEQRSLGSYSPWGCERHDLVAEQPPPSCAASFLEKTFFPLELSWYPCHTDWFSNVKPIVSNNVFNFLIYGWTQFAKILLIVLHLS